MSALLLPLAHHPQLRRQVGEAIEQQTVDKDLFPAHALEQHAVGGVVEECGVAQRRETGGARSRRRVMM